MKASGPPLRPVRPGRPRPRCPGRPTGTFEAAEHQGRHRIPRGPGPPRAGSWSCWGEDDFVADRSFANLPDVQTLVAGELNAYDILVNDWVVFTDETLPQAKAILTVEVDVVEDDDGNVVEVTETEVDVVVDATGHVTEVVETRGEEVLRRRQGRGRRRDPGRPRDRRRRHRHRSHRDRGRRSRRRSRRERLVRIPTTSSSARWSRRRPMD